MNAKEFRTFHDTRPLTGTALDTPVSPSSEASAAHKERFELVKIAFEKLLPLFFEQDKKTSWEDVGSITVKAADAVLAEMGKDAPDAKEIEQRARKVAGDVVSETENEKVPAIMVLRIRAELTTCLDRDLKVYADNPTEFRSGHIDGIELALRIIDQAIEKHGKADSETANGEIRASE